MLRAIQWATRQQWLLRALGPAFGKFHPFIAQHRNDPHATWRRLRETEPVYRSTVFGAWICTRYDDVSFILRDKNFTTDRWEMPVMRFVQRYARKDQVFAALIERNLLVIDGAEHRRLRGLVSKAFTPRQVERLRPALEATVDDLLDQAGENGEIEIVRDLAHPLPVIAIAELLGVPASDRDRFNQWSSELIQLLDPLQGRGGIDPIKRAAHEIFDYFRPLLAERRREPRDDLLSAMLVAEENGERLDEDDLLALSSMLLVAGHETTSNLIGNAIITLLRNPDERKRLQDDPGLLDGAVDEFLRFESPIQLTDRCVIEDCEIGGQTVRKGQMVVAVLQGANRDPERFTDPDRFDVGRTDNHHLAFSQGNHFCIGSQLAKLETEIAVGALLRRFPDFSGPTNPTAWRRSMIVRGPEMLPVRLI